MFRFPLPEDALHGLKAARDCVLALIAVVGLASPAGAKAVVILNSDDDTLSVIDTNAYKEISRVHIGRAPHHLILTPDRQVLIIAMSEGNELVFIDRATGMVKRRLEVSDPYQLGFSPDGKWFVAASLRLDRIDIYDGSTFQLAHRLPAATTPSHMGFSPDSRTVYVSLQGSDNLTAIDLASGNVAWTVPVGPQPAGVWTLPSGRVLVALTGSDYVAEVDPHDGSTIRRIRTGRGAHNFQISLDGRTLFVSNRVAGTISLLDPNTLDVTGTINAPGGPDDMVLSNDGSELWVTGRWRASVSVIELGSGALKATIPVGRSPHGIFLY